MKTLALTALVVLLLASCNDGGTSTSPTTSKGNVPPAAAGKWLHGTFAMSNFWGYDGSYQGNPFTQSVAFNFTADGNYEMYYAGETLTNSCRTDALSYYKGYVVFDESTFTVHPQSGRFRGFYSCATGSNFDRPATSDELRVQTYYYHYETDVNNKKWMVVGFKPNDDFPSYFGETAW